MSAQPFRRLTDQQLIRHLQQALQADQNNGEAHSLLARLYLRSGENTFGESHLRQAADAELSYLDDLLAFCRNRRRPFPPQSQIQQRLQQLTQQLASQPADDPLRVRLALLLVVVNQLDQAEQLLAEGLQRQDSAVLRKALAELRLFQVRVSLLSPKMVGDESLLRVREALRLDPTSEEAAVLAALLHLEGADFTDHATEALQHWQTAVQQSGEPTALRSLAMLQFACGRPAEALELFARLPQKRSEDAFVVITALQQTDRKAEAVAEAQSAAAPQLAAGTVTGRTIAAELYCRAQAFAEAQQCLEAPAATAADSQLLSEARGRIAMEELDAIAVYPGHFKTLQQAWTPVVPEQSVQRVRELIQAGLQAPELSIRVADRLYLLTVQGGALGAAAEEALTVYRAQGGDAEGILMAIGSRALQVEQFDTALHWLQQARNSSSNPSPSLLNNLAIAIVRSQLTERYAEALTLANAAVQALPGNHIILATRAEVYLALNEVAAAQQDLEAALQLRPDYPETLQLLARTADLQGNTQQADGFRQQAAALLRP
jgi:predicted Zn-dependent protease